MLILVLLFFSRGTPDGSPQEMGSYHIEMVLTSSLVSAGDMSWASTMYISARSYLWYLIIVSSFIDVYNRITYM